MIFEKRKDKQHVRINQLDSENQKLLILKL